MKKDLTLEKLHATMATLAKKKAPMKDNVPIEFFLLMYDQVGLILV